MGATEDDLTNPVVQTVSRACTLQAFNETCVKYLLFVNCVNIFFFFYFQDTPPSEFVDAIETMDATPDSPTTSRAIDMMDLDPSMMDEPYDSGFLQSSAPIPIRFYLYSVY